MTTTPLAATAPPDSLRTLIDRFDPTAMDLPARRVRIRLDVTDGVAWDALVTSRGANLGPAKHDSEPDALLAADRAAWDRIERDVRGGMEAFRRGGLHVRRDLHLGVGLLAATSGATGPERLEVRRVRVGIGNLATVQAGAGEPVVAIHGLGGTKASFLPTVAALASSHRVIAMDLPGFGDSVKPVGARYDARFFARSVVALLDALELERAHLVGNSMGGRVALEVGLRHPGRAGRLALLCSSLAWLRGRRWAPVVRFLRPELGLLQVAPRGVVENFVRQLVPGGRDGWAAAGVDEFLRAYLTPRGRAAFYAAARSIYLEQPEGEQGFWTRLARLEPDTLFVWGRQDTVVPLGFARHVREVLPAADHLELDCGHVPQLERPKETHAALRRFLSGRAVAGAVRGRPVGTGRGP